MTTKVSSSMVGFAILTEDALVPLQNDITTLQGDVAGKEDIGVASGLVAAQAAVTQGLLDAKQETLVSATNIRTVNGSSLLGAGDLVVTATSEVEEPSAVTFSYSGGFLTSMAETLTAGTRNTTFAYGELDELVSTTETFGGVTRITNFSYTAGVLTSYSVEVS